MLERISILAAAALALNGQDANFAGGLIGVSTLSADGRAVLDATGSAVSLYKPDNGFTAHFFAGRHLNDFLTLQGSYGWNRNALTLTSVRVAAGVERAIEQSYSARHHTVVGDLMLYFRPRASRLRPYLSAGAGVAHFSSAHVRTIFSRGSPASPAARFSSTDECFRVAVGIDIGLRESLWFRYSFAETLQRNPVSGQLSPPGSRNLANFQNLFGVAWAF